MLDIRKRHTLARERLLAEAIKELAAELRLVDVIDFVAFVRLEHFGNIADIVHSSSELYFKPGVLRFADSAEVDLAWNSKPIVALALQFRHGGVEAHFRLELASASAAVDITYMSFDVVDGDPEANTQAFAAAIKDSRILDEDD
ncbi:hypothetical protein [Antarcticirhabdus aurantiaca]|uniref:Uncharacterized protein n=1 Tax=Antarcticirhabdus aurantiaca TaxID=2606717 RepID=A0ACD4NU48_9HYPH|nr:hypothetical protein [Antarcticirhabdus aurantiaca]WAJ30303.1 hypothetical protein OXU80_08900 [Jeongeuplla avenae]